MIEIKTLEVRGFKPAIIGMRNPMNSWDKSDSGYCRDFIRDPLNGEVECNHKCPKWSDMNYCGYSEYMQEHPEYDGFMIGPNDHDLMMKLRNAGTDHRKFMRMIVVYADITAPLFWWKEASTYKVGTVFNSCSTMHKIHSKEFVLDDFSHEHLLDDGHIVYDDDCYLSPMDCLREQIHTLNMFREKYLETKDKKWWWQMIELLPSSYNQKRTAMFNYEVLANIYKSRKNHKLDDWHSFCDWIETLPYSEIITNERDMNDK